MPAYRYEREYNLSPQVASEIILNWLFDIKAKVFTKKSKLPKQIIAKHGKKTHLMATDPLKYKVLDFSITPLDRNLERVKIHLHVPFMGFRRESVSRSWEDKIFSEIWERLSEFERSKTEPGDIISYVIKFINKLAGSYDFRIPISRIRDNFDCDIKLIREIVEKFNYHSYRYIISDEHLRMYPIPKVIVKKCEIEGNKEFDIIDKIEVPLKFYLKNMGKFPVNVFLHVDPLNLPAGKEHPPFKIAPDTIHEKVIHLSTKVKDDEYLITAMLCDNDNDRIEIAGSEIEIVINKKTSKKQKLKNIVKKVLYKSANILAVDLK